MRLDNAQSLREVIEQWRASMGSKDKWNETRAVELLKLCIPKYVSERIINVRVKDGVMFVSLDDSVGSLAAIKQEMFYKRRYYTQNINKRLGVVFIKDIIFK